MNYKKGIISATRVLINFMFFSGILVCISVPFTFRYASKYYSIFDRYYIPFCIIFMVGGALALMILWELRNIFSTVVSEDPFVRENVISLKRMGLYAFFIAIVMASRLFFIITPAVLILITVFLVAGLFSLVLSQVFDQAVTFKQENDLTI